MCQENGKLIPVITGGSGFDFYDIGNGEYLYKEEKRKEKLNDEKIKKIKRRIVDKVYKATPAETLQIAYNNNVICDQLFK